MRFLRIQYLRNSWEVVVLRYEQHDKPGSVLDGHLS